MKIENARWSESEFPMIPLDTNGVPYSDTIEGYIRHSFSISNNPAMLSVWHQYRPGNSIDMGGIYAKVVDYESGVPVTISAVTINLKSYETTWGNSQIYFDYSSSEGLQGDSVFVFAYASLNLSTVSVDSELRLDDIFIGGTVGQEEFTKKEAIAIYPNPAVNEIMIQNLPQRSKLTIIDFSGKVIKEIESNSSVEKIDLSELSKGIYIIEVDSQEERIYSDKLILTH